MFIAETEQQAPFRSKPHPITGGTEVIGHRRDKTDFALATGHLQIAGGATSSLVSLGQVKGGVELLPQPLTGNLGAGALMAVDIAQGISSIKEISIPCSTANRASSTTSSSLKPASTTVLSLIFSNPAAAAALNSCQHLLQITNPGQLPETVAIQAVDTDIKP